MLGLGGLITGGIGSLFSIANGLSQKSQANKLEKQSVRPIYNIPGEISQNQKIAERESNHGLSGTQYNNDLNNINNNVSAGISALNQNRNSLAGIGNLVAQANSAALNLDSQDDAVKRQNLAALLAQNENVAQYRDKAFQYNNADKYKEEQDRISALRGAGNQNIGNAVNGLSNLGMSYFLAKNYNQN